ncbi:hypothetical protein E2C01_020777 [Portunus trituberculatus]|uniref:Uncharacterized protein n=1 Tax=Portunus trituberculatus TaxID=210409 RepID=A0A5B7E304_PORTR|nr:hypothetical protein [Portunus trituberculatus]
MGHQQDNLLSLNTLYCLLNCRRRQTLRITRRLAHPSSITANTPHTPNPWRCTFNGRTCTKAVLLGNHALTVTPGINNPGVNQLRHFTRGRTTGDESCRNEQPGLNYFVFTTESRSVILGPEYVKAGSTINLTCVINQVNMAGMCTASPPHHGKPCGAENNAKV